MDQYMESLFNLNPFTEIDQQIYEEFDPHTFFEMEDPMTEIINEAVGATVKNVFTKLWSVIVKGVRFIVKIIGNIGKGIKRFLVGGGKSADQVAEEAGLERREYAYVPSKRELSDTESKNVEAAVKSIIKEVKKDGSLVLNPAALVKADDDNVAIKGKTVNAGGRRASEVIKLIKDPRPLDVYKDFFTRLTSEMSTKVVTSVQLEKMAEICNGYLGLPSGEDYAKDAIAQHGASYISKVPFGGKMLANYMRNNQIGNGGGTVDKELADVTITMDELMDFQRRVDEVCKLGEEFDNHYKSLNVGNMDQSQVASNKFKGFVPGEIVKKSYMQVLNDLAWICVNLQGGLHAIAQGLAGVYDVSPEYRETIKDPNMLARFTEGLIASGIPGKYVVSNIYMVCTADLKGNPKTDGAGHVTKPIMGFGRLTLIPEGDIIYKIAINRYGVRSNKNDFAVLNEVKKIEDKSFQDMFADTIKTYGNYTVNVMEKVKAGSKYEPDNNKAKELAKRINDTFAQNGVNLTIVDIKSDAFGMRGNDYVILDYGYINRTSVQAQT